MNKISDYLFCLRIRAYSWLLMHWHWLAKLRLYVIADATDNSITFSKDLFRMLDVMKKDEAKVYVTRLCNVAHEVTDGWNGNMYGFIVNYPFSKETQLADIQYNQKHRCIGFECLCPTVNQIFFDYGLPAQSKAKLSVLPQTLSASTHKVYYIMPPKK